MTTANNITPLLLQKSILDIVEPALVKEFKTFLQSPLLIINPDDLPIFGCYIGPEERSAEGDGRSGPPAFLHRLTLYLNGAVNIETGEKEQEMLGLHATFDRIDELLLTNPRWVNLTESIASMRRETQYTKQGDTTLGEIRVSMVLVYRSVFEPVIPDVLETIHVKTVYPSVDRAAQTQQVEAEIVLEQH